VPSVADYEEVQASGSACVEEMYVENFSAGHASDATPDLNNYDSNNETI